jgi:hypothetical protein
MRLRTALCCVALLCISAAAYAADPVTITFDTSPQTGIPGGPDLIFSGNITNNTAFPIFLIGDMLDLTPNVAGISIDDTPLFLGAPPFGTPFLDPAGTVSFSGPLLDVSLDTTVPNGLYTGTLTLLGGTGPDGNPNDTTFLGSNAFQVRVVPEPGVMSLLAAGGVVGAAFMTRRQRRSKA